MELRYRKTRLQSYAATQENKLIHDQLMKVTMQFPSQITLTPSFFFINSLLHTLINFINMKCEIPGNICKPKPQTVQPGMLPKYPPTELSE